MVNIDAVPQTQINTLNHTIDQTNDQKNKEINQQLQSTNLELADTKQAAVEATVAQIKDQIRDVRKQVRFAASGEGKDVRAVKNYIFEWLDLATKRVNKYKRYHRKFDESERVLDPNHEAAMFAKIATLLANSKDYVSQAITGDIDEAKKFFPPNVFTDASYYIPDRLPSKETRSQQIPLGYEDWSPEQKYQYQQYKLSCES